MAKSCTKYILNHCTTLSKLKYLFIIPVLMLVCNASLYAQNSGAKITGTIKDTKGEALFGVSVLVKGTTVGTSTDDNGKFTISAPNAQSVLVISYIGFLTKEIVVGNQTAINITLTENASNLSEVVVLGYGQTVTKSDLVGSIGTVSAKQIDQRQPLTLADALQGQVAGALVVTDGGDPFSQGNIQIRGAASLQAGNGPLYVIDGVLSNDATFLNPQDIATVEVLKDAASASIYGVRGANGVILITTKRGKDGKATVNGNYYHVFSQLAHKLHTVSANDLRFYRANRDNNNGTNPDSVNHYLNADNDYQDLLFRTGNKDNVNVSLSGGQKGLIFYGSANYANIRSIILNSQLENFTTLFNVDYQVSPAFKISNHTSFSYQTGNQIPVGNSAKQVFERNPWTSIYKPDGTYADYVESKRNPVAFALFNVNEPTTTIIQDNFSANYQIYKDLKFTTILDARNDEISTFGFSPSSITSGGKGLNTGSTENEKKFTYEIQAFFNYNKTFGKDHSLKGVLGFTRDHYRDDDLTFGLNNYLSEQVFVSSVATIDLTKTSTQATYNSGEAVFAQMQYSFKDRYYVNGTIRRDGSSRFGPANKWGNFGAGGFAWRLSSEKFMAWSKSFLDDAKLRYSIGVLGNDKVSDFGYVNLLNFGTGDPNTTSNSGVYNGNTAAYLGTFLGNPTIKWETTTTQNLGIDLTMFNGRLSVSPEYYFKNTTGLLYRKSLPEETGSKIGAINLGNIQNKGFEITVSGTPVAKKNLMWTISANVSLQSAGVVKELADHTPYIAGSSYLIQEGGHIGDFYLLKNLGVYQYDVSNAYDGNWNLLTPVGVTVTGNTSTATGYTLNGQTYTGTVHHLYKNGNRLKGGSTIWENTTKDSIIDDQDRQILGNAVPTMYFGLTNNITFKNFNLSFIFNGSFGGKVYNSVANGQNTASSTYSPPTYTAIYNSWHKQGDVTPYPDFTQKDTYGGVANGVNSLYLEDGSFIRLQSANLTYNISKRFASKISAKALNVYIYGNNLVTWTNYTWYDPEFTSTSSLTPGTDNGKYPHLREAGIGLRASF